MSDSENILVSPGENSQSVKMVKFTSLKEIKEKETVLKAYIYEAIEVEKAGLKVELKKNTELQFPSELLAKFKENTEFQKAFEALTPGRQRAYNMHFTAPKQTKTKISRIENSMKRILSGKGLNDCVCGLSKRMPTCDGSHNKR